MADRGLETLDQGHPVCIRQYCNTDGRMTYMIQVSNCWLSKYPYELHLFAT